MQTILVGKPEGRRTCGRPTSRWEDNIRLDLREIWWTFMDWIRLAQDKDKWWDLVKTVTNLQIP